MKTYEDYYSESVFRGQDATAADPTIIRAGIYFGIRLQTTFMANQFFYKILGFFTREDVINYFRDCPGGFPSLLKINQQSDLARLGVIREITFAVIPSDPARTIAPYGAKYNTGVPYAVSASLPDLIAAIYDFKFSFGAGADQYEYKVEPGSIKEKKSRKTTPNFA